MRAAELRNRSCWNWWTAPVLLPPALTDSLSAICCCMRRLQPLTGWAKALPGMKLPHPGKCPTAFIVICQNTEWDSNLNRYLRDVGAVAQTMLLAATEMGLGGIMIGNFSPAKVSEAMKLPETIVPMLIVAFGKPDEKIVLTEVSSGESIKYYRDDQDVHYVPKRKLEDIVIRANAEKYDK